MIIKLKAIIALILGYSVMYKITVTDGVVTIPTRDVKRGGVIFNCNFTRSDAHDFYLYRRYRAAQLGRVLDKI